jgi:hypothetical protein
LTIKDTRPLISDLHWLTTLLSRYRVALTR